LSGKVISVRLRLKCNGTRAEARFRLSAKRTSPFKSAGASVQSTNGSRGNAEYTMFRGSVKCTGYPLHSPVSTFTSPPVRHRVPSHFSWTLHTFECVCSLSYPASTGRASCNHLWPVRLYSIFPHYLIKGTIFLKQKLLNVKCVF
jgi:hypothetical protein